MIAAAQAAPAAASSIPSGRMLVVANRLPVSRIGRGDAARWQSSAGGLVTALEPIVRATGGSWIGWSGAANKAAAGSESERSPEKAAEFEHHGVRIRPVSLSQQDIEQYYHGMSNSTFWPLYHDAIRPPDFRRDWWWRYVEVNERFAQAAAAAAQPGDMIWVQDYHLQLVPRMIRALRDDVRIGFFLHIPFPPEELFAWLPWRAGILEGLLGADLIGFQTYQAVQNFSRAARAFTSAEAASGSDTVLTYEERKIHVKSFPIAIDSKWFEETAATEHVVRQAADIRRKVGGPSGNRKILLCVDRLDYTKGIDARLCAYEEFLRRGRFKVEDCVLMQIAVPSRERVADYAELRTRIEQMVGRINGEYSSPGHIAVHYFRRNLTREELVAYYRAADVMLVTPLRDGMNLVAKEYVATRVDGSGVLVLSEFAGAARELRRALLVNPRDEEGMATAMEAALSLDPEEARQRMAFCRTMVRRHDVFEWAGQFVEALK
jgi:trehalose 6-phosphate synthase